MYVQLKGQIERITYTNEETGYTVAKVKVGGRGDLITVVGNLIAPIPGEMIAMSGEWIRHPRYGEQFKVAHYQSLVPASVYGIERYLGSGLIRGIGPIMARRIVGKFGEKTLEVIEHEIERLAEVEGIGEVRIGTIKKAWEDQKEIRDVMIFLQTHGVGSGFATKIFKQYGSRSIAVVRENPYRLATDVFGIGFLTADRIAEKLGFSKDSGQRVEAGILYVLSQLADEGHVYYPYEPLIQKCEEILGVDRGVIIRAADMIADDKMIVIEELVSNGGGFEEATKGVYLARFHHAEKDIAARLQALMEAPKSIPKIDQTKAVEWVQGQLSITLAPRQIEAVRSAVENKLMIITGGPGTGKTTIINAIIKIFSRLGVKVVLAAPTGRAAKRMSEATGHEAKTIHRMLEYSIQKGGFQKDELNPLDCELMIIDEASMIDTILMYHLLRAIPPQATFIMVGDVDQLPSVGAGNVLKDCINSGRIRVLELNEIFRQAKESLIVVNAHKINSGMLPLLKPPGQGLGDFYFIEQDDPSEVLRIIVELVKDRIPRRFGFDPVDDIQVLTPMHKGEVGVNTLNEELQKALNPADQSITRGGWTFKLNDKVMQVKNNYDKEVFNGDIGRIRRIDSVNQEVIICFDDRDVPYEYADLDEIVLAYAVSVHKSQGSEYPAVIMPMLTQHYVLLQRNLVYTAVTRGRGLVVMIGTAKALAIGIGNDKTQKRYTYLRRRLG
ncbi:MAG: ATP-dependent RecD-like DNA helicase [Deltaproteobacteria bacterium]|nr:ATP-dependent RecD-like DNA helicase [Deltaproteobacteria bacterium]